MSNFGTMTKRILNELDRDDMTADVQTAIQSAIRFYSTRRFWWNEQRWTASTTEGQEYYPLPDKFREVDTVRLTVNQNDYMLIQRRWSDLEEYAVSPNTYQGYPTDYAVYRNELRLYPVPNGVYTMHLSGATDLPDLSSDASTNKWMTHGEELIRSRAAVDVLENVLQDYDGPRIQLYRNREREVFQFLNEETKSRLSIGRVKKARW